jgi:hypothetical protein
MDMLTWIVRIICIIIIAGTMGICLVIVLAGIEDLFVARRRRVHSNDNDTQIQRVSRGGTIR